MTPLWQSLVPVVVPTRARLAALPPGPPQERWWGAVCALCVVPLAAALHHAVFYRPTCMMMPFDGTYGDLAAVWRLLSRDPSLPWAIALAALLYGVGRRYAGVRRMAAAFFVSTLPFSVWIWDLPFTGRFVCRHFHDSQTVLLGVTVHTRHWYLLAAVTYAALTVPLLWPRRTGSAIRPAPAAPSGP